MTSTKRLVIKIFVAVAFILIAALTLVALFSLLPRPVPTYNFLGAQRPLHHVKDKSYRIDFYSFRADVNNIHTKISTELTSLGYANKNPAGHKEYLHHWELPDHSVLVTIKDNRRVKVFKDPRTSQYSSPDRYWDYHEDGWITIEVRQKRRDIPLFFYRLIW